MIFFFSSTFLPSENVPEERLSHARTALHLLAGHSLSCFNCVDCGSQQIPEKAFMGPATNTCHLFITELTEISVP